MKRLLQITVDPEIKIFEPMPNRQSFFKESNRSQVLFGQQWWTFSGFDTSNHNANQTTINYKLQPQNHDIVVEW